MALAVEAKEVAEVRTLHPAAAEPVKNQVVSHAGVGHGYTGCQKRRAATTAFCRDWLPIQQPVDGVRSHSQGR